MKIFFINLKFNIKNKGSLTVEASMIFPLIMFIFFGIIYLTIVHYQNNVIIAESIRAMNRAGAYWQYVDMNEKGEIIQYDSNNTPAPFNKALPKDGIINTQMIKKRNAYRSFCDLASEAFSKILKKPFGKKKYNSKEYLGTRLANVKFKKYTKDEDTKVGEMNGAGFILCGDDLKINVGKSYLNPILGLSRIFFGENSTLEKVMQKDIVVSSVISNQSEFVRNFDTIYDLISTAFEFVSSK